MPLLLNLCLYYLKICISSRITLLQTIAILEFYCNFKIVLYFIIFLLIWMGFFFLGAAMLSLTYVFSIVPIRDIISTVHHTKQLATWHYCRSSATLQVALCTALLW